MKLNFKFAENMVVQMIMTLRFANNVLGSAVAQW